MTFPRNLDYETLIKKLSKLGYEISRQRGSHIRLTTKKWETFNYYTCSCSLKNRYP